MLKPSAALTINKLWAPTTSFEELVWRKNATQVEAARALGISHDRTRRDVFATNRRPLNADDIARALGWRVDELFPKRGPRSTR